jgi:dTDP-4-dehydrorhamnose reductase
MRDSEPILVLGALGLIGSTLMELLAGREAHGLDRPECDVTKPDEVARTLKELRPSVVINATGFTDVDGSEVKPEEAAELNGEAPGILARACGQADCLLVHLSTDFVFDGASKRPYREDDTPNPLSVYGRTKLAGEEAVRREGKDWIIVRTGWVFGHQGRDFVRTILRLANENNELNVVDDQTGCPTYSVDIGRGIMKLIEAGARGTFHLVNSGQTTWFGLANKALSLAGINGVIVNPITSRELGRPAQRPVYSVLDTARFQNTTRSGLRSWEEALSAFIKTR